jgi:hypothetical protein
MLAHVRCPKPFAGTKQYLQNMLNPTQQIKNKNMSSDHVTHPILTIIFCWARMFNNKTAKYTGCKNIRLYSIKAPRDKECFSKAPSRMLLINNQQLNTPWTLIHETNPPHVPWQLVPKNMFSCLLRVPYIFVKCIVEYTVVYLLKPTYMYMYIYIYIAAIQINR